MIDPKISIIVPVYNSADYLRRCLNSLINQSLEEIEILIFDDCSTDNSVEIIEEYLKKSNKLVFVKNETNLFPGVIRNTGVQKAKGKYIMFVDSDDWIDCKACEILFEVAEQNSLEILIGKHIKTFGEETKSDTVNLDKNSIVYEGCTFMMNNNISSVVWNKLWLRDFIIRNNLKNTEGRYYEDHPMTIKGLMKAKRLASINYEFYYHFIGSRMSIIRMIPTEKHINDKAYDMQFMLNMIENYEGNPIASFLKKRLGFGIYAALSVIRRYPEDDQGSIDNLLSKIKVALSKTGLTILTIRSIPVLNRILVFISPVVYLKASRIFDKLKS